MHQYGRYDQPTYQPPKLPHFHDRLLHPVLQYNGELHIRIDDPSHCFYCLAPMHPGFNVSCPNCGFPQCCDPQQQKEFIAHKRLMLSRRDSVYERRLSARNAIIYLTVVFFVFGLLTYFIGYGDEQDVPSSTLLTEVLMMFALFGSFTLLTHYFAYAGVLATMVALSLYIMFAYFFYGLWLFTNIWVLLKLAISLGLLIYAFMQVSEANNDARELRGKNIVVE